MTDTFVPNADLIDRYMQRQLDEHQEEQFEMWLLEHPDALPDLESQFALHQGIKELGPLFEPAENPSLLSGWRAWLMRPTLAAAMAAIALAAIVIPSVISIRLADQNSLLEQSVTQLSRPSENVFTLPLEPTRGPGDEPNGAIVLGDTPYLLVLEISLGPAATGEYQVELSNADQTYVLGPKEVDSEGYARIALNTATLTVGRLDIEVRQGDRLVQDFWLRVE